MDNLASLTYWHARIKFSKLFRLKILNLLYVLSYLTVSFESTLKIIFQFEFFICTLDFKLINEIKKSNRRNHYKIYKIRRKLYSVHKKHPSYIVFSFLRGSIGWPWRTRCSIRSSTTGWTRGSADTSGRSCHLFTCSAVTPQGKIGLG